jgi:hypothetical protein
MKVLESKKGFSASLIANRSKVFLVISIVILAYGIIQLFLTLQGILSIVSVFVAFLLVIMVAGHLFNGTQYSFVYWLYLVSCALSVAIASFLWVLTHPDFFYVLPISIGLLLAGMFVAHFKTYKNNKPFDNSATLSMFLFGLVIALGNGNLNSPSSDILFWISMVLYALISIPNLNASYRILILNKKLKIRNIDDYLRSTKEQILKIYASEKMTLN